MRLLTWNCCWKLKQKLYYLLNETPDIAILQECSKASLEDLPNGYDGQWLHGSPKHGLGLIYREPYVITNVVAADQPYFVRMDVAGPISCRLIGAWNCPPKGLSYPGHLYTFVQENKAWFDHDLVVLAGDLNSQLGASFDRGRYKHMDFVASLRSKGLVDVYAALRESHEPVGVLRAREATHHHQWKLERPFHLDYVFASANLLARVSSITVGAPSFWSNLSDHSPVIVTFAEQATTKVA